MTWGDLAGLTLSYLYSFGIVLGTEWVGRRFRWSPYFTRKVIHIGSGLWVWAIVYLFDHWYYGIIPFGLPIVLNLIIYRTPIFRVPDSADTALQTISFALAVTILLVLFWRTEGGSDHAPIAIAAIMAMTIGDAMAALIGQRIGRHPYTMFGNTRTWEGSGAMVLFSFGAILFTLLVVPGSQLSPNSVPLNGLVLAITVVIGTTVAALAEAFSPSELDNLTVPVMAAMAMYVVGAI